MPKRFGFKRSIHHALMGAGAVLHPIFIRRPSNPAEYDALALKRDLAVVGVDMWDAIAVVEAVSKPSSRSSQPSKAEQDVDDSAQRD